MRHLKANGHVENPFKSLFDEKKLDRVPTLTQNSIVHTYIYEIQNYSAFHRNSPFARFIKLDVALAWLNIKFSSMAHLKQLSANFHLPIQKFQKSQGY